MKFDATKSMLVSGENFDLYNNIVDDENIYLYLQGVEFEASNSAIVLKIPVEIWGVIRQHGEPNIRYANWTNDQIRAFVTKEVDDRIEDYNETLKNQGETMAILKSLCYSSVYGSPCEQTREEQISLGCKYIQQLRDIHTRVWKAVNNINTVITIPY